MDDKQAQALKNLRRFGLGLSGLGAVMILFGAVFLFSAWKTLTWPKVEATIVRTEIQSRVNMDSATSASYRGSRVMYDLIVQYAYTVDGTQYVSQRYSIGGGNVAGGRSSDRAVAENEALGFPIQSPVTAYYDPDDPSFAILRAGLNLGAYAPLLIGLFLGASGLLFVFVVRSAKPNAVGA